jgi:hypothetical protein
MIGFLYNLLYSPFFIITNPGIFAPVQDLLFDAILNLLMYSAAFRIGRATFSKLRLPDLPMEPMIIFPGPPVD